MPDNESLICFQSQASENTHNHTQLIEGGEGGPLGIYYWTLSLRHSENKLKIHEFMHRAN